MNVFDYPENIVIKLFVSMCNLNIINDADHIESIGGHEAFTNCLKLYCEEHIDENRLDI